MKYCSLQLTCLSHVKLLPLLTPCPYCTFYLLFCLQKVFKTLKTVYSVTSMATAAIMEK